MRNQVTDIDVYAVRYSAQLSSSVCIIEAMGNRDSVSEVFRVYGFKSYFRNCDAILVSDRIDPIVLDTAKKLSLRLFSLNRLRELSANNAKWVGKRKSFVPISVEDGMKVLTFLGTIKALDAQLYWSYHYLWLENNPYLKLVRLHDLSERCAGFLNAAHQSESTATEWYLKELMLLSLLSCVEIAGECIDLPLTELEAYLVDKFYNLGTSRESKMKIKGSIQALVDIIGELSHGGISAPPVEIVPSYLTDLTQTVKFLIRNAPFVQSYILLNEAVYRNHLCGRSTNIRQIASSAVQQESVVQLNAMLLKVLYGSSTPPAFNDFV